MTDVSFADKFVGYVDVLGFKALVEAAEAGIGMSLSSILEAVHDLGTKADEDAYREGRSRKCPASPKIDPTLDLRITQFSDSVIVSAEVSPAGIAELIGHCWTAVLKLLTKGLMCRGYITRGSVYHTSEQLIGSGFQNAYLKESQVTAFKKVADERGTPFVEVDPVVVLYIKTHGDDCVKGTFARQTRSDGEVTALFPFQVLAHSFMFTDMAGHMFDPARERRQNHNMRSMLINLKTSVIGFVDRSNRSAMSKAEHYLAVLDRQLEICDRVDSMINLLS